MDGSRFVRSREKNDTVERWLKKAEGGGGRGDQLSHNSRRRGAREGGDTHSASPIVQRAGVWFVSLSLGATRRMIYLGRAPASLPPRVPLMLISSLRNCTKARHVWSVNFCHHKSIGHARGGGSFRRIGGREIGPRPSCCEIQTISNSEELGTCIKNLPTIHILKIDSESTNLFYLYPGREIPSFLSERVPVVVFIKSAGTSDSSSSSSVVPLNRASKSSSLDEESPKSSYIRSSKAATKKKEKRKETCP